MVLCLVTLIDLQTRRPGLSASADLLLVKKRCPLLHGSGLGLLLFNGTFSTNRLYHAIEVQCISRRAGNTSIIQLNSKTINQENHMHSLAWAFWRRSPRHG